MPATEYNTRKRISLGQDNNALTWLLILNAVVFAILIFIRVVYLLEDGDDKLLTAAFRQDILSWFVLPASASELLYKPWTILTYMFTHFDVWYIISNMLWLWCFGYILQDLAGNNKLIPIYIYGGLTSALIFSLSANLIPSLSGRVSELEPLIGAGPSVIAIAVATTALAPNYRIFPLLNGGIPLWVLTLVFIAIDLTTVGSGNAAVALAHIAGACMGFFFVQQLRLGRDLGAWMPKFAGWVNDLFNPEKKHVAAKVSEQHFYKATRKPFKKTSVFSQQKLDEILDKINTDGYSLLSDEEKDFLKKASKEDI